MAEQAGAGAEVAGLERLEAFAAQEAALYASRAVQLHDSAELSRRVQGPDGAERFLVIDLAATLRIGQQAADRAVHEASRLVQVLPVTLAGLQTGRVFTAQARIVLAETAACSDQVAAEVDRRLHAGCPDGLAGWIARRLCARLRRLVLHVEADLEPQLIGEREQRARQGRRMSVRSEPDGMACLWALLPAEQLRAFTVGFDELHRRQIIADREAGVERTADQRRADLLALLPALALHALEGSTPADPGHVCPAGVAALTAIIHVPLATAAGLSEVPAELVGYGPVSAAQARQVLRTATLQRLVVDDVTGEPLRTRTMPSVRPEPAGPGPLTPAAEEAHRRERLRRLLADEPLTAADLLDDPEPQHDPSAGLARFVRLRDPLCTAPGCATSSSRCDLDHGTPWPHGPTAAGNLRPLSRRCHRAKTFSWRVRRTGDGAHHWSSPTGRTYVVPPYWDPPPEHLQQTPTSCVLSTSADVDLDLGDDVDLTAELDVECARARASAPPELEAGTGAGSAGKTETHTCTASCEAPF